MLGRQAEGRGQEGCKGSKDGSASQRSLPDQMWQVPCCCRGPAATWTNVATCPLVKSPLTWRRFPPCGSSTTLSPSMRTTFKQYLQAVPSSTTLSLILQHIGPRLRKAFFEGAGASV